MLSVTKFLSRHESLAIVAFLWNKLPWLKCHKDLTRKTIFEGFKFNKEQLNFAHSFIEMIFIY